MPKTATVVPLRRRTPETELAELRAAARDLVARMRGEAARVRLCERFNRTPAGEAERIAAAVRDACADDLERLLG